MPPTATPGTLLAPPAVTPPPRTPVVVRPPVPLHTTRHGPSRELTAAVPASLVLALGLWGITRQNSMWRDEAATWQVAHRDLHEIWHLLGHADIVHGLYYALMHILFEVFGDSLLTLRIPSVIAMAVAASLAADLGARLADRWSGLGAGLAFALLPTLQTYAQEGRPYAMVTATVTLASWLLVAALHRPRARIWSAYALVVLLGALLNWFSLLALLAHAAALALARPHRAIWARWFIAVSTAIIGATPLILASRDQAGQVSWIQPSTPMTMYAVAATVVAAGGCAFLRRARTPAQPAPAAAGTPSLAAVAVPLCALPQVVLLTVSLTWQPLYVDRYVLFAQVGLALLLGVLISTLATSPLIGRPGVLLAAVTALAFVALLPMERQVRSAHSRVDDVLAAATLVTAAHDRGAGAMVFIPSARRDTAMVTPGAFPGLRDIALAQSPADSGTLHGIETAPRTTARAMLREPHIILISDAQPRPAHNARDLAKQRVLHEHFVPRSITIQRGRSITLYERIDRPHSDEPADRS
ncbi:glycosyltransferase family 39 protein [Streptomyces sp. ID05-39B]|uniref:glycosyltransferase family 39 protein n=1 Tax=Streptomyces sp. ID05-39B TaxID=3028664 RepID=UPI0029B987FF|nr:glycosyltransferase family 39 protein [Streptomyces sp. ID05-39B]MDX3528561.1 glycosyltransferase family 39 protein [Streptomyces sp. ID05-39B]